VRDRLSLLLASEMPRKIPLLRAAWGVDDSLLPTVDRWISGDPPEEVITADKEHTTWVIVVNPRLLKSVRTGDFSPAGEPEYHNRYACRIYLWTLGDDWNIAIAARDNLAAVASQSLKQYPTLSTDGGDTGYRVNEDTYTEDYGAPVRANGSRSWAAAILSVDIDVEEVIDDGSTLPPFGTADTLGVTSVAVGPGQPFPEEE
jgi:hypothetical protein